MEYMRQIKQDEKYNQEEHDDRKRCVREYTYFRRVEI